MGRTLLNYMRIHRISRVIITTIYTEELLFTIPSTHLNYHKLSFNYLLMIHVIPTNSNSIPNFTPIPIHAYALTLSLFPEEKK